jgi:histidinol-phosphate aminotransferase
VRRDLEALASPWVRGLVPYSPGKPVEEVERELGVADAVKLASNENPLGPSPKAMDAIAAALKNLHRYPDGGGYYLKERLARAFGLTPDHFILGNGTNELLELAARVFLVPGDEAIYAHPAFVVYDMVVQVTGARKVRIALKDYTHDLEAMADAITPRTKMIFVANPNNPTGTCVRPAEVERFMGRVPEDVLVVFDDAYYEYLPSELRPDTVRYVREERPALVLRTFSKIYGLAGLRIGYGIAPPALNGVLNRVRQPFNTNDLAQRAALAALDDDEHVERCRRVNEEGKRYLAGELRALGVKVVPTAANFFLVDVGRSGPAVAEVLLRKGVIVRPMAGAGLPTHLRITIGTPTENRQLVGALRAVLAGPAAPAAGSAPG